MLSISLICAATSAGADDIDLISSGNSVSYTPFVEFRARAPHADLLKGDVGVGHAFLFLGRQFADGSRVLYAAGGFYPADASNKAMEVVHMVLSKGQVKYTVDDMHDDEVFQSPITSEQESRVKFIMEHWNEKQYSVVWQNCVSLDRDVARSLGLKVPEFSATQPFSEFPNKFLVKLREMNSPDAAVSAGHQEQARIEQQKGAALSEAAKANAAWNAQVQHSNQRLKQIQQDSAARQSLDQALTPVIDPIPTATAPTATVTPLAVPQATPPTLPPTPSALPAQPPVEIHRD